MRTETPTITVPTLAEVQLGPLSQRRNGVECGCFLHWDLRIMRELEAVGLYDEARQFTEAAHRNVLAAEPDAGAKIFWYKAANTAKARRIAYNALRSAWLELGYVEEG